MDGDKNERTGVGVEQIAEAVADGVRFTEASFRQGLHEAVLAACEEHDRGEDEILSPRSVWMVGSDTRGGGFPIGYEDPEWALLVQTKDGRIFRVVAAEIAEDEA